MYAFTWPCEVAHPLQHVALYQCHPLLSVQSCPAPGSTVDISKGKFLGGGGGGGCP